LVYGGDGGPAANAGLMGPGAITVNPHGVVYFGDMDSFLVRAFPTTSAGLILPGSGKTGTTGSGTTGKQGSGTTGSGTTGSPGMGATMGQGITLQEIKSGKHAKISAILLQFSEALNGADAQDLGVYSLVAMARSKKHKGKPVSLVQARYNPSALTVTLSTRRSLVSTRPLQLTIHAAMLHDSQGMPLDGGANLVAVLGKTQATVTSAVPLVRASSPAAQAVDAVLTSTFRPGGREPAR
jgi:hypothetical protein